ncbi:MAG: TetR family transcriptional regulator C-terminal domain-containing protein [Pseudomonadota bacterium]
MDGNTDLKSRRFAPKEVRKQQLIDATIAVIAEKGVSGTTTAQVTGKAGLSAGIISLHFENKDNLLKATLEYLAEELQDKWQAVDADPALSAEQKLWGIIAAGFHPDICSYEKIRVWFAFFGEAEYRAFYREMVDRFDTEREDALTKLLVELGQSQDQAKATTQTIESLADGLWLTMMLYPHWLDRDASEQRIWDLLCLHFPDLFHPDGRPKGLAAS